MSQNAPSPTSPRIDKARWDGKMWRLDIDPLIPGMEPNGFVAWGGGTFGAGKTPEEAIESWRQALADLRLTQAQ